MEKRALSQEYAKHKKKSDNLPQDVGRPWRERRVTHLNKLILLLPTEKRGVDCRKKAIGTVRNMRGRTRH